MTNKLTLLFVFLTLFVPNLVQAYRSQLPELSLPLPVVTQSTYYTCGPASSMSILRYFGMAKGQSEMGLATKMETTTATGTRFWNMAKILKQIGLEVKVRLGTSLSELRSALLRNEAVVLNIDDEGGHYVVLAGMDDRYVYFMDPWYAYTTYTRWEIGRFETQWYDSHDGVRYDRLGIFVGKKRR